MKTITINVRLAYDVEGDFDRELIQVIVCERIRDGLSVSYFNTAIHMRTRLKENATITLQSAEVLSAERGE